MCVCVCVGYWDVAGLVLDEWDVWSAEWELGQMRSALSYSKPWQRPYLWLMLPNRCWADNSPDSVWSRPSVGDHLRSLRPIAVSHTCMSTLVLCPNMTKQALVGSVKMLQRCVWGCVCVSAGWLLIYVVCVKPFVTFSEKGGGYRRRSTWGMKGRRTQEHTFVNDTGHNQLAFTHS